MSTFLAQKKAQQKSGPEVIMYWMGGVIIATAIIIAIVVVAAKMDKNVQTMSSFIFLALIGCATLGVGAHVREYPEDSQSILRNWLIGMILFSVLGALVWSAYIW